MMQAVVTIEGLDRRLSVAPGELLLTALLSRGVPFAYSCQSGACGTCKCRLVAGEVGLLTHSEGVLSDAESEQGVILACRSLVQGDLTIRLLPV
jgi:ferredoxin